MAGGTEFHFITGGIDEALKQATTAAGDKDVRVGGVSVVRQYCRPATSTMCIWALRPLLLGEDESPFPCP
jgi:dihydrofolate reductase